MDGRVSKQNKDKISKDIDILVEKKAKKGSWKMLYIMQLRDIKTHVELSAMVKSKVGNVDWQFSYSTKVLEISSPENLLDGCQKIADSDGDGNLQVREDDYA